MRLFLILAVVLFAKSVDGVNKIDVVKSLFSNLFQSALPTPTPTDYDPVEAFAKPKETFARDIGIWNAVNGNKETTLAKVTGPVNVIRPPLESVIYYLNYTVVIMCESSLERWDCPYCIILGRHIQMAKLHYNQKYHTKWMITVDHRRKEVVLTFRPSYNIPNFILDTDFSQTKVYGTNITIHNGFFNAVNADWNEIVKVLKQLIDWNPTYKLIMTGQSLGAAMAIVTTFFLKHLNVFPDTRIEVYGFGEPRCGNKAFVDYINNLNIPVVRVSNKEDGGPRFVPAIFDFYHHHNELYLEYDRNGTQTARYCSTVYYEDPTCGQTSGPLLPIINFVLGVANHILYFGTDITQCAQNNIVEFILQSVWPLRQYIPKEIQALLPPFAVNTSVIRDIVYLFDRGGKRELYKLATKQ